MARARAFEDAEAEKMKKREEILRSKRGEETVVERGRWRWRVTEAETGKVGFRYGVPHEDRKKGQVKIPTRVE